MNKTFKTLFTLFLGILFIIPSFTANSADKNNCSSMKLTRMLDLLARPRGFEPLTLGLEMRGIDHTNDLVLHRFVILQ